MCGHGPSEGAEARAGSNRALCPSTALSADSAIRGRHPRMTPSADAAIGGQGCNERSALSFGILHNEKEEMMGVLSLTARSLEFLATTPRECAVAGRFSASLPWRKRGAGPWVSVTQWVLTPTAFLTMPHTMKTSTTP